jgi:hypothetical protein
MEEYLVTYAQEQIYLLPSKSGDRLLYPQSEVLKYTLKILGKFSRTHFYV